MKCIICGSDDWRPCSVHDLRKGHWYKYSYTECNRCGMRKDYKNNSLAGTEK